MIIFYGQRLYGKVDVVPGLFHVSTVFFHLEFIPLIPLRSCIVVTGGNAEAAVATSFSFKSMLVGWVRTALVISMLVSGIMTVVEFTSLRPDESLAELFTRIALCAGSLVAYWVTLRLGRASYDRALALGAEVGCPPALIAQTFHGGGAPGTWEPTEEPDAAVTDARPQN